MAGFKLGKPKSSRDAEKFIEIGKSLSTQAPTNIFNQQQEEKKKRFKPAPKKK